MAEFEDVIDYVLKNEGGYSDSNIDCGGETNFGISAKFFHSLPNNKLLLYLGDRYADRDAIKNLTLEQAKKIYRGEFWNKEYFYEVDSIPVCQYLTDTAINMGSPKAIKLIQRSIMAFQKTIIDDGILGHVTIGLINEISDALLPVFRAVRAENYRNFALMNVDQNGNLKGWLRRAYELQ